MQLSSLTSIHTTYCAYFVLHPKDCSRYIDIASVAFLRTYFMLSEDSYAKVK